MIDAYFGVFESLSPTLQGLLLYLEVVVLVLLVYQWTLARQSTDPINDWPIPAISLPFIGLEEGSPRRSRRSEVSRSLTSDRSEVDDD